MTSAGGVWRAGQAWVAADGGPAQAPSAVTWGTDHVLLWLQMMYSHTMKYCQARGRNGHW